MLKLRKSLELINLQYNVKPSLCVIVLSFQAAIRVGLISVIAGGGGTLLGGTLVKKFGLRVRGLLKLSSLTQLTAIVMAIGLMAGCSQLQVEGDEERSREVCGCLCDRGDYSPVCDTSTGQQFYNPCFAGCQEVVGETYYNCTCVLGELKQAAQVRAMEKKNKLFI